MAVFMFWNTNRTALYNEIGMICQEHDVDVAIFAESRLVPSLLLTALNPGGSRVFVEISSIGGSRIQFFTRYPYEWIEPTFDSRHISVRLLKHPVGGDLLIIAVHLPSKLHQTMQMSNFTCDI